MSILISTFAIEIIIRTAVNRIKTDKNNMNIYIIKITETSWSPVKTYIDSAWENLEDAKLYVQNKREGNTLMGKIVTIETIKVYKHYYIR